MGELTALRQRLVDGPDSLGQRNRQRRWAWLCEEFPGIESMSVIDLGGTVEAWLRAPVRPASVHVVNLEAQPKDTPDWLTAEQGDACTLPASLDGAAFDLVFSNSVIEHVGGHARRQAFADSVHALADAYWVQTPYRYFPIEPHWVAPAMQFMPVTVRAQFVRRWPLSDGRGKTRDAAVKAALKIELLDRTQMNFYFPGCQVRTERAFGLTKSLIVYRTGNQQ